MQKLTLTTTQTDAIAKTAQAARLEGKPKVTQTVQQEIGTQPWDELTSAGKDQVRLTVRAVIQGLEQNGFEVRQIETAEKAGGR